MRDLRPPAHSILPTFAILALTIGAFAIGGARAGGAPDGKKLFAARGCIICHSVGAPSKGPGPELTQVAYQRNAEWLRAWLADPKKLKSDTIMPKPSWESPQERDAVIEYLLSARRPIPPADSTDGARLFADYGCDACHAVRGHGGKPQFPELSNEGAVRDAGWLDRWLADPPAVKPGTFMPRFPLTPAQRRSLVAYLGTLKKK